MGIFDINLDHLSPLAEGQGSIGPTSGFLENFSAASEKQYRVDSFAALQAEMGERFGATLRKAQEASGDQFEVDEAALLPWVRKQKGVSPFSSRDPWRPFSDKQKMLDNMGAFNKRLHDLKREGYDVQTLDDILSEVEEMRGEVRETEEHAWARAGIGGMAGSFLGSMWGSLSFERDPVLVGSLLVGGGGRLLATRLLGEFAVGAGAEAVQQFAGIRPTRELLGEEQTNPWFDIAVGGALGAGFAGAFEVAPRAFRAVERRVAPQRAEARALRDAVDAEEAPLDLGPRTNEELLAGLERLPQSPQVRAAREALLLDMELAEQNPFGSGREAHRLAAQSIGEQAQIALGRTPDTAVGRFLPEQANQLDKVPEPAKALAREQAPQLYRELEEAELRLQEIEAQLLELSDAQASRRVSDAIGLIDEASGLRAREIEAELDGAVPRSRREALEAELDLITESLGPEQIAQAEADASIGPKRQRQAIQRSRQAARKEVRRLQKRAAEVEAEVLGRMQAVQRIEALRSRSSTVEGEVQTLGALAETRDARAASLQERALGRDEGMAPERGAEAISETTPEPPSEIDLGDDDLVPADFRINLNEEGTESLSAREIFQDLADDDAMLEAMKRCSI